MHAWNASTVETKRYAREILTDQVNRLIRHYTYVDQRSHAEEEWWAGAVALDHFLIAYQACWTRWLQPLQISSTNGGHELLWALGTRADPITNIYANLFESPDPYLSNALLWARTDGSQQQVAAWMEACSQ